MALVGGLILGLASRHAELHPEATAGQKFRPHIFFNLGRIIGYALLGGAIGLLGNAFKLSPNGLGALTFIVGAIMVFLGLKLVQIFPALKDRSITLPSGVARYFGMSGHAREYSHRGAVIAGALTFFLPCGFTQAMQAYAVSTGSFFKGAAVMGLFAIGTAPGLLGIGGLTSALSGRKARRFFMIAGLAVIALGLFNVKNSLGLFGFAAKQPSENSAAAPAPNAAASDSVQEVRMTQNAGGYDPDVFTVQKGRPVRWIITSTSPYSCAASIVMREYGVSQGLALGENIITFTPTRAGIVPFSCGMGMYRGRFIVTDSANGDGSAPSAFDWYKTTGVQ
jgi:sulfite exporter TauE/SafE